MDIYFLLHSVPADIASDYRLSFMGLVVLAKKMLPVIFKIFYFTELQVVIVNWTLPPSTKKRKKKKKTNYYLVLTCATATTFSYGQIMNEIH